MIFRAFPGGFRAVREVKCRRVRPLRRIAGNGFRDFDEILKDHDIHTKATELKLITVFNWEGAQKYHLANENDAQEVSNSLHIETVNQNTDGRDSPWRFATLEEWMKNGT